LCHVNNSTTNLHIYMGITHGIYGKWWNTFFGIIITHPEIFLYYILDTHEHVSRFSKITHKFVYMHEWNHMLNQGI
jgi:hypothetical protein